MADVVLARQQISVDGLTNTQTAIDATDVYYFEFDNKTFLHIVNGAGGASIVTFTITQAGRGGTVIQNETVTVAAGDEQMIGPFPDVYGELSGAQAGRVHMSQDQAASVTAGVYRV